jgi:hypothetical protein
MSDDMDPIVAAEQRAAKATWHQLRSMLDAWLPLLAPEAQEEFLELRRRAEAIEAHYTALIEAPVLIYHREDTCRTCRELGVAELLRETDAEHNP